MYHEGSKKHLDDPIPNSDFLVSHCPGTVSLVLGIFLSWRKRYVQNLDVARTSILSLQWLFTPMPQSVLR